MLSQSPCGAQPVHTGFNRGRSRPSTRFLAYIDRSYRVSSWTWGPWWRARGHHLARSAAALRLIAFEGVPLLPHGWAVDVPTSR